MMKRLNYFVLILMLVCLIIPAHGEELFVYPTDRARVSNSVE